MSAQLRSAAVNSEPISQFRENRGGRRTEDPAQFVTADLKERAVPGSCGQSRHSG
jgi:hypothetical protein